MPAGTSTWRASSDNKTTTTLVQFGHRKAGLTAASGIQSTRCTQTARTITPACRISAITVGDCGPRVGAGYGREYLQDSFGLMGGRAYTAFLKAAAKDVAGSALLLEGRQSVIFHAGA